MIRSVYHPLRKLSTFQNTDLEVYSFRRLQLQLELIRNQRNELRIGGFAFGVAHRVAEETLERVQVASVPCHFDGVADGPLHSAGGGLEGFCHLGV